MRPSSTARRYAEAAFDVARQDNDIEEWLEQLRSAGRTLGDRTLALYFKDPSVPVEEKLQTVHKVFANDQPHVMNLFQVLTVKQRMHLLPAIVQEFEALEREERGVLEAYVTVARDIDEAERARMAEHLGRITGKQIQVHVGVDASILGGVVVRIGDRLIDGSVAGRLQRLRQEIAV